ncbi:MAG: ATP-binding protein, partial [Rivularia sp. (in: cyanobacteria)]
NISLQSEFHMTNDSYLFYQDSKTGMMPLYEGKMIHQFNHKFEKPRYWIIEKQGRKAVLGRKEDKRQKIDYQYYRLGCRKIARNTDLRTMIATVIPPNFHAENFQSVRNYDNEGNLHIPGNVMLYLCGVWNSFVLDYLLRLRVTANVNFFYIYQLPVPRLTKADKYFTEIVQRAAKLICTTPEFDELALETLNLTSLQCGVTDETQRAQLRAELDGMIAHLYGLTEGEFGYILSTFPIVAEETKQAALSAYRDLVAVKLVS